MLRREQIEQMDDLAKLFAPEAARLVRNCQWEQAVPILLERCRKLDIALQSLTPGGSEYVGDPERCVRHAVEVRDRYRRFWLATMKRLGGEPDPKLVEADK